MGEGGSWLCPKFYWIFLQLLLRPLWFILHQNAFYKLTPSNQWFRTKDQKLLNFDILTKLVYFKELQIFLIFSQTVPECGKDQNRIYYITFFIFFEEKVWNDRRYIILWQFIGKSALDKLAGWAEGELFIFLLTNISNFLNTMKSKIRILDGPFLRQILGLIKGVELFIISNFHAVMFSWK